MRKFLPCTSIENNRQDLWVYFGTSIGHGQPAERHERLPVMARNILIETF